MNRRVLIGSSFFFGDSQPKRDFAKLWLENTAKADVEPTQTVVILEGGATLERHECDYINAVFLTGDLGHIHDHLEGRKNYEFTGWSASMCALAMLAYVDCADFIYKESDCLAWGPWVEQMYRDLGDGQIVFGPKMTSAPWMPVAQSLFLVKHAFIPKFISAYLAMGRDGDPNKRNLGEHKFEKLEQRFGRAVRKLSFGVDRMRPIPFDAPVFYAQQFSPAEVEELKRRNLV